MQSSAIRIEEFLSQTSVLFASDVKAVHQNTLAVLNKLAKERKEFRDAICCVAAQGLMSREESTQSKIVKLILAYGETESATLREALSVYTETMLANTKKELKAYLENNESDDTSAHNKATPAHFGQPDNDSASFVYEPILPIIREDNRIQKLLPRRPDISCQPSAGWERDLSFRPAPRCLSAMGPSTGHKTNLTMDTHPSTRLQTTDKRRKFTKRPIRPTNGNFPP